MRIKDSTERDSHIVIKWRLMFGIEGNFLGGIYIPNSKTLQSGIINKFNKNKQKDLFLGSLHKKKKQLPCHLEYF